MKILNMCKPSKFKRLLKHADKDHNRTNDLTIYY